MKKISLLALVMVIVFTSCQEDNTQKAALPDYPEALENILTKHGGIEHWKEMKALTFEFVKEEGNEKHQTDLQNRRDRVEGANFALGNDGTNIWADTSYKGNAAFYHNLLFYFYAMPFVLADEGIIYTEADTLHFEGKSYPGIHIAFQDGVGQVSTDEYILHYDAETYQMAFLGYTVTFKTQEKSDKFGWIHYNEWQSVDGFALPKSLTWCKMEDGKLVETKKVREFTNVIVGKEALPDEVFAKTESGKIVE